MSKGKNPGHLATLLRDYDSGTAKIPAGAKVWLAGEVDEHFWTAYYHGDDLTRSGQYLGLIPADALSFETVT
jgi:hypothetical protein